VEAGGLGAGAGEQFGSGRRQLVLGVCVFLVMELMSMIITDELAGECCRAAAEAASELRLLPSERNTIGPSLLPLERGLTAERASSNWLGSPILPARRPSARAAIFPLDTVCETLESLLLFLTKAACLLWLQTGTSSAAAWLPNGRPLNSLHGHTFACSLSLFLALWLASSR